MKGQNQARAAAQPGDCFRLATNAALDFQVQQVAASGGGFAENFQFRGHRPLETTAVLRSPAGADGGHMLMIFKEPADLGQGGSRLLQIVQAEFEEGVIPRP